MELKSKRNNTIQFLYSGEIFKLPPFLTIIESLKDDYNIKVLCYESRENYKKISNLYTDVQFQNIGERQTNTISLWKRIKRKIYRELNLETTFHKKAKEIIVKREYDKLWIIHENTLNEVMDLLDGEKYIISMYELNDARCGFLKKIEHAIKQAEKLIVCEYNRAQILRVWMNLSVTPYVIPNKPFNHPHKRNMPLKKNYNFGNKKIILYQGHIQKNRNIDSFCKAISDMDDFILVIMGAKTPYSRELESNYPKVKFIDFVNPPEHLYITSHAYIGIVKYDYVDLNSIFCAPNKTYEYAGFGIPMIANSIPGLVYSIGMFGAAECIDTDNVNDIKNAILKIDANYIYYEQNALNFYNEIDIKALLNKILNNDNF